MFSKWKYLQLQPFNGLFSRTTWVSRYQKGKTNLDFIGARDSEWQWHQLGHMHVCTSLQTDNHASTPPLCFFTGRKPFLPPNQQRQSTECIKWKYLQTLVKFASWVLTDTSSRRCANIMTLTPPFDLWSSKWQYKLYLLPGRRMQDFGLSVALQSWIPSRHRNEGDNWK